MQVLKSNLFLLILLSGFFNLFSQPTQKVLNIPDSITQMSYNDLYRNYIKYEETHPKKSYLFAYTYLKNAKKDENDRSIVEGYHYISSFGNKEIRIKYLDSAIALYKNDSNYGYPGKSYLKKGFVLYEKRDFKEAIDNLLIANKYGRKHGNSSLIYYSNYLIAMLTDRIGNHQDAIKILKEYPKYIVDKKITKIDTVLYLQTNFALAIASYKLKKLDSATYYNDLGIKISLASKKTYFHNHFILSSGVTLYHQGKHQQALDSVEKSLTYFKKENNKPNLAVSYFYKGKILYETGNKTEGILFLKKLDTIFQQQQDILPETREGYEILINNYKEKQDLKSQLAYTQKLVAVDKVLNLNYKHVQTNIITDYYTPILISKKLEEENKTYWYIIYSILTVLGITVIIMVYSFYRQLVYKKKFKLLLEKEPVNANSKHTSTKEPERKRPVLKPLNISEDLVSNIIDGLQGFERSNEFTDKKYTLTTLAKELKTNSTYLSKIINEIKGKNFSSYITDLRIDYAIDRLKSDSQFRMYSIKSISEEIGFKNTESFSKAFHRKTGLYPSYFIKQLLKKQL